MGCFTRGLTVHYTPGLGIGIGSAGVREAINTMTIRDRQLKATAASQGKQPCMAIPSAFKGGSFEDEGVPDELKWPQLVRKRRRHTRKGGREADGTVEGPSKSGRKAAE